MRLQVKPFLLWTMVLTVCSVLTGAGARGAGVSDAGLVVKGRSPGAPCLGEDNGKG